MMRHLFFPALVLTIIPLHEPIAAGCDSIITHGLRNISISKSEEALIAAKWFNHCQKDFNSLRDDQLAQLEVEVIGYGGGNASYSRNQSTQRLTEWCTNNRESAQQHRNSVSETQTFYQGAVSAWESCIRLRSQQLLIDPVISPDGRTVDIGVVYRGPTDGVAFSGLPTENFTCKAQLPEGVEITFPYKVRNEAVQIRCTRDQPKDRTINGTVYQFLPRGTISVQTASDPFQLFFSESWEPPAPITAVDELRQQLTRGELPVGTVIASVLTPDQFMSARNPAYSAGRWVPADGRQVSADSLFARLSSSLNVPDLRAEEGGLNVLDVVVSSVPHGAPVSQTASLVGNAGSWTWLPSPRSIEGSRYNGDWEQAVDAFEIYADGGTIVAQGRTHNFKHGAWGPWKGGSVNLLGISTKRNRTHYYVKIN